ncbi:MAG TPA: JAB domain-containing protein [Anaerolineales bacterium]|nr:JAB domain-containing protein [Anaerolineales bacterium]
MLLGTDAAKQRHGKVKDSSGDPTPSPDDVAVTRAIVEAGKLLDVEVLDHLVIGEGKWVSLKERGLGFV